MRLFQLQMLLPIVALICIASPATAQEIRYSWLDLSFMGQDVGLQGALSPLPEQIVAIAVTDGTGVRFRGSIGTWNNLYAFIDYGSTDIALTGTVTNTITGVTSDFADEYDFTSIRGGVGLMWPIFDGTDIFGELTLDSLDFDFGSFAGEDFDMSLRDFGGRAGVRTMFGDHLQARLYGRYTNVGDPDLTGGFFDPDVLVGAGFTWEFIRGMAIVGDYESGQLSAWSLGFRLDLDED